MVEQNTSISITQADITGVLSEKNNLITNLELQLSALKRTVIELQSEATLCQCKEEQESNSDKVSETT
jgi:TolA-binding protein